MPESKTETTHTHHDAYWSLCTMHQSMFGHFAATRLDDAIGYPDLYEDAAAYIAEDLQRLTQQCKDGTREGCGNYVSIPPEGSAS